MSRPRLKVLVADDNGTLAPTCIIFLAWWGHEVEVVHDGLEALRVARSWKPDLVISHGQLATTSGLSLIRTLRSLGRRPQSEFFIVGPAADVVLRSRALALGAAEYLETPITVPALREAVQRVERLSRLFATG
jgi:CheY-like chemotaxis protein